MSDTHEPILQAGSRVCVCGLPDDDPCHEVDGEPEGEERELTAGDLYDLLADVPETAPIELHAPDGTVFVLVEAFTEDARTGLGVLDLRVEPVPEEKVWLLHSDTVLNRRPR